jgi:hypothetical protein
MAQILWFEYVRRGSEAALLGIKRFPNFAGNGQNVPPSRRAGCFTWLQFCSEDDIQRGVFTLKHIASEDAIVLLSSHKIINWSAYTVYIVLWWQKKNQWFHTDF